MVEVLYKNAISNDVDIARCDNYTYFGNIRLGSYYSSTYKEDKRIVNSKEKKKYVFEELPNVWNKLIRKDLFDDIRFREHLK